jgi:hypothetical protein
MFELILQNVESRSGSLHNILHLILLLITTPPDPLPSRPPPQQQRTIRTHITDTTFLNHVSSPAVPRPHPGLLGPRLCRSSTGCNFIPIHAHVDLRPRNSPFRTHSCRKNPPSAMRQSTMFIWSRSSRNLTGISGDQYYPLYNLRPVLYYHLRH